ncbi:hypothetical protein MTO96_027567 [Rhipicephalus appendiculatus]
MVNFAKALVTKVWKLVLGFFGVLRRAMCCFRKRRRASDVGLPVYLTAHGTEPCTVQQLTDDLQSWDSWNEENGPCVSASGLFGEPGCPEAHFSCQWSHERTAVWPRQSWFRGPETGLAE